MTRAIASFISRLKSRIIMGQIESSSAVVSCLSPRRCVAAALRALIIGLALWQAGYGLMQLLGAIPSRHHLYPVTGSFYNPGPYGCFLALAFPLALYEAVRLSASPSPADAFRALNILRWPGAVLLILEAMILPVTLSRTAWLAALLGSLTLFLPGIVAFFHRHRLIIPLSLVGLALLFAALFFLKENSARGRLLMWKVAVTAIDPRPFAGVGPDHVAGAYGEAQERYFSVTRPEKEILVADAPDHVFNEYLQTALAFGWGAAALLVVLLLAALAVAARNGNLPIAGCTLAAMTVMSASYPLQFHLSALLIALIIAAAFLSTTMADIAILGSLAALTVPLVLCSPVDRRKIHTDFSVGLSLHKAGKWEKSNEALKSLLPRSSDPMPLNIIGKNYRSLAMPDSAEHYLLRASRRCPNRLYPHYLLMRLYADSLHSEALREARTILAMQEKVASPATDEMRREALDLINRLRYETESHNP